jgi:DNA-binding beta-propeller fold protein YncE
MLLAASAAVAGEFSSSLAITGYQRDTRFGEPSGLAVSDRLNTIYLTDVKDAALYAFNMQGVPKSVESDKEKIGVPYAVAVDKDGNVYVATNDAGPIKVIDSKGEVTPIELEVPEGDQKPKPGRMAFDREGNLYVVDRANSRLYVLDKDRRLKMRIGGKGSKRGEFRQLQDAAIDRSGRIYALDALGIPVQVFDKKGKYLYRFGFHGGGDQDIGTPNAIALDRNDQVWIVDKGQHCLKVFDRAGEFLRRFGTYGVGEGTLFDPVDIEIDGSGRIYVAESGARRVQVFIVSRPYETFTAPGF